MVLAADAAVRRSGSRRAATERLCRRGLEIFILAFLFRVQAFIVSPGNPIIAIFRVDILNVMGPSLVAAALVWFAVGGRARQIAVFGAIAAAVAMLTPVVRTAAAIDLLPVWLQWYLRPAGEHTTFTLFPWSGFVMAGAACGAALVGAADRRRVHVCLAAAGILITLLGFYTATLPSIYKSSSYWTSSPTYFAVRTGIMMLACAALFALEKTIPASIRLMKPVERFGQASLFVYWIHVELVYGYATWLIHGRLPLPLTLAAATVFSGVMFAGIVARGRFFTSPRSYCRPAAYTPAHAALAVGVANAQEAGPVA